MKKLTKALKGTLNKLEVKGIEQLKAMSTSDLNKHMRDLTKCYEYEMSEDENEMTETLIEDINSILKDRLEENLLIVADIKEETEKDKPKAPAKDKKKDKPKAPAKDKPKAPAKEKKDAPAKEKKKDKPKAPAKADKPVKTVWDKMQWKSIIELNDNEGSTYNVYIVDIGIDKSDCICRAFSNPSHVFHFFKDELIKEVYTDENNVSWKMTHKGIAD